MVDRYDEELFLEYVEGELPVEKRVAFENQMLLDPRLRNLVAQMVLDRHRIRTLPDEAPPDHLMDAVHERLERAMLLGASPQEFTQTKTPTNHGFRWRRYATMGAMAAMISVVAGVFIVTLVQLANETPIRNIGPGSLFPPGMQSNLLPPTKHASPPEPAYHAAVDPAVASTKTTTSTPPDIARVLPPASISQVSPEQGTGEATPATAAVKATSAGAGADASIVAQLSPLPAAQIVLLVVTPDVPAASRRLVAWSNAYDAKLLDSRKVNIVVPDANVVAPQAVTPVESESASIEPDQPNPSSTANQPLAISPAPTAAIPDNTAVTASATKQPANQTNSDSRPTAPASLLPASSIVPALASRTLVTLSLPSGLTETLETFLATLPDAAVQRVQTSGDVGDNTNPQPADVSPVPFVLRDRKTQNTQQQLIESSTFLPRPSSHTLLDQMLPDQTYLPAWLLNPNAAAWHLAPQTAPVPTHTVVRVEFTTQQ